MLIGFNKHLTDNRQAGSGGQIFWTEEGCLGEKKVRSKRLSRDTRRDRGLELRERISHLVGCGLE